MCGKRTGVDLGLHLAIGDVKKSGDFWHELGVWFVRVPRPSGSHNPKACFVCVVRASRHQQKCALFGSASLCSVNTTDLILSIQNITFVSLL